MDDDMDLGMECLAPERGDKIVTALKLGEFLDWAAFGEYSQFKGAAADWAADGGFTRLKESLCFLHPLMKLAEACWREAALLGSPEGQYRLGSSIYNHWELAIAEDKQMLEASQWLKRAAVQGHAKAASLLAHLHEKGHGIPQDLESAAYWYKVAVKMGDPGAALGLRRLWAGHGLGTSRGRGR